ncbi:transposase domain-containing protein [Aquabacterium humicola]|uniref:transposase domain-containing protein n=1 Tax=Aquabacterium humicola TaxID=3237377 RepID=UPI003F756C62
MSFCSFVSGSILAHRSSRSTFRRVQIRAAGSANGIDGYRYLAALLVELPKTKTADDHEALLPWRLMPPTAK